MNLTVDGGHGLDGDFPRASGDEPRKAKPTVLKDLFSPREWG